jgi:poly(A) polymerase
LSVSIAASAEWLFREALQELLAALGRDGEEARIAGGAVRNALLGEPVADVDIATTCRPEEVIRRVGAIAMKAVPTGIEHGTVTVVADGHPYEVTTLREDVETDGRRAKVRFGRDWRADARRRDFTINGLFSEADGTVVDFVGGIDDIRQRRLRFIGDPAQRIREDYLRILRFFRFFAWYGDGRPDAEGLKACARLKDGLDGLSAERVWAELKRMLCAPDPGRALLWMRQANVLTRVLPETEKWGIDAIAGLIAAENTEGWAADPLLRLAAMIPPRADVVSPLARRLKLSKAEGDRLLSWAQAPRLSPDLARGELPRSLYRSGPSGISDRLRLDLARALADGGRSGAETAALKRMLSDIAAWRKPRFPVSGKDLAALGMAEGPRMGEVLAKLEEAWIEADFAPGREQLLARAADLVRSEGK